MDSNIARILTNTPDAGHKSVSTPSDDKILLSADLKEIIAATTVTGALEAIAKISQLSGDVCEAIASTLEIPAVATLLANENAQIREETLDSIIT